MLGTSQIMEASAPEGCTAVESVAPISKRDTERLMYLLGNLYAVVLDYITFVPVANVHSGEPPDDLFDVIGPRQDKIVSFLQEKFAAGKIKHGQYLLPMEEGSIPNDNKEAVDLMAREYLYYITAYHWSPPCEAQEHLFNRTIAAKRYMRLAWRRAVDWKLAREAAVQAHADFARERDAKRQRGDHASN